MTAIVRRIDHIVTLVRDLDAAESTYFDRLGFPRAWARSTGEGWTSSGVSLGNANLELLTASAESTSMLGRFFWTSLQKRGEGLFMIAFDPGNIEASISNLRARGVVTSDPVPGQAVDGAGKQLAAWRNATLGPGTAPGVITFLCQYDLLRDPGEKGGILNVKKLDHVVIATGDLDAAAQLWERNLGLRPDAALDKPLGAGFKVARLPIGDAFLELVQPVAKEGRFYQQFQERGEGMFSISIEVEDLGGAIGYLQSKGVRVSEPEPGIWPGSRVARINQKYTHGVSIQLIERK